MRHQKGLIFMLDGEKLSGEQAYEFIVKAYEEAKRLAAEREDTKE